MAYATSVDSNQPMHPLFAYRIYNHDVSDKIIVDNSPKLSVLFFCTKKKKLDISCESIHIKCQALISLKKYN